MSALIKAEEVRAGDTLRVTFEGRYAGNNMFESGAFQLVIPFSRAATIERLAHPPLKAGDLVNVDDKLHVWTLAAINGDYGWCVCTDSDCGVVRPLTRLTPALKVAKVDGVFEAGDRVVCVDDEKVGHATGVLVKGRVFTVRSVPHVRLRAGADLVPGVELQEVAGGPWFASRFKHAEPEQ